VGAAEDIDLSFPLGPGREIGNTGEVSTAFYSLALVKPDNSGSNRVPRVSNPRLSVVLSPEARRRLDRAAQHLRVEFEATTGARANDIPIGTEFQVLDSRGVPLSFRATATLLSGSSGGTDGLALGQLGNHPQDPVAAAFPYVRPRRIGEVMATFERYFGNVMAIIDPRDLLRQEHDGRANALLLRVRFVKPGLDIHQRCAMLASCERFLNRYVNLCGIERLRVVDVGTEES
jgi:hypothetical protein